MVIDETDPDMAWVIPATSDEVRVAPDLRLQVYETTDAGSSWESRSNGLPADNAFDIVLRHAFAKRGSWMVFGTNNGNLYISENRASKWRNVSQNLAKITTISFADA